MGCSRGMEVPLTAIVVLVIVCIGIGYGLHEVDLVTVVPLVIAFGVLIYGVVSAILRYRYD